MLNLLNAGFEHSVRASIDGHTMIIVANDGGFVESQEVDVSFVAHLGHRGVYVSLADDLPGCVHYGSC